MDFETIFSIDCPDCGGHPNECPRCDGGDVWYEARGSTDPAEPDVGFAGAMQDAEVRPDLPNGDGVWRDATPEEEGAIWLALEVQDAAAYLHPDND